MDSSPRIGQCVYLFMLVRAPERYWYQKLWNFLAHLLIYVKNLSDDFRPPKHLRKSLNNFFFDIKFPGNWFRFSIILDDFFISLSLCFKILNILEFNQIISFKPHDQVWTILELITEWTAEPSSDSTYWAKTLLCPNYTVTVTVTVLILNFLVI